VTPNLWLGGQEGRGDQEEGKKISIPTILFLLPGLLFPPGFLTKKRFIEWI
jgi:hypothetical protein